MSLVSFRPYQLKAISNFELWIASKERLGTIILPTGTGKTFTAVGCIEKFNGKVLWVAHREELIDQAVESIQTVISNRSIDVEMSDRKADSSSDIIVGSVQTVYRSRKHMEEFVPDLIVIDEYHHYDKDNKQYHSLLEKFPKAKILGLTATPYRFSGGDLPLGKKLYEMDIGTAVSMGFLVPPRPEILRTQVSLANVKTRAGDFAINELSEAVNVESRNKIIIDRVVQLVKSGRQGIVFAVDVAHSKAIAEGLRQYVRVGEIYGETEKDFRREIVQEARAGNIDVLVNNLTLTEGADFPHLSFACIARPTKSLGLWVQMAGRVLRLFKNKTDALLIDVFDIVKSTQSRVTYADFARVGDIDGSRKRSDAIMKHPIADKLENFPVIMKLSNKERWTIDNDTWLAPAFRLDDNQWAIVWNKTSERIKTGSSVWKKLSYTPKKEAIKSAPVRHSKHGEGKVIDVIYGQLIHHLSIDFNGEIRNLPLDEVEIQQEELVQKNLPSPIQRAFYIISNDDFTKCRMIHLLKGSTTFKVEGDLLADRETIEDMLKAQAINDDVLQIVKSDAKWRLRSASDKQKAYIKSQIAKGLIDSDIDFNTMTGGEASSLMDQLIWKKPLNNLLGAVKREDLIGNS